MSALFGGGVSEAREPFQRRIQFSTIRQNDMKGEIGRVHRDRVAIKLKRQNAHSSFHRCNAHSPFTIANVNHLKLRVLLSRRREDGGIFEYESRNYLRHSDDRTSHT